MTKEMYFFLTVLQQTKSWYKCMKSATKKVTKFKKLNSLFISLKLHVIRVLDVDQFYPRIYIEGTKIPVSDQPTTSPMNPTISGP